MDEQDRASLWRDVATQVAAVDRRDRAQAVCTACVAILDGIDAATVTLRGAPWTRDPAAATRRWAANLADPLGTLDEGPGVRAYQRGVPVLVTDVRDDPARWPRFAAAAVAAGVGAVFCFPLQVGGIRLGSLDLYRFRPGDLHDGEVTDAVVAADLATQALLEQADARDEKWLRPLTSYAEVNIATGMIAAQLSIGLTAAFAWLRARSASDGRPLRDVARDVVERRLRPTPRQGDGSHP